jgi:hyperosmotically inducible protein
MTEKIKEGTVKTLVLVCCISLAVGTAAAAQAGRERLDTDLRRQLSPLVGVFDNVTFKVEEDRTVILSGQVREPEVKRHIEEDAKRVDGVQGVENRIEVLPLSRSDDELRLALYRAIYGQEGLQRYSVMTNPPIHIVVKNGAVSLEGMVANKLEYAQVNAAANQVFGAFSVKNNLLVEGDAA